MISLPYSIRNRTETLGPREQSCRADTEVERPRFWNSATAAILEYPPALLTESRKSGRRADIGSAGSSCPVCVPSILHVCFSGRCRERFGENMFCHFALKVPHVFWMLSFETQRGHPLRLSREDRAWVFEPIRSRFESQFCGFSRVLSLSSASSFVKII